MKKQFLKVAALVALAGVMTTACSGTKQVAQSQPSSEQSNGSTNADKTKAKEEVALVKTQQELDDADVLIHDSGQANKKAPILEVSLLEIPCLNEALDKEPEKYITGFGIGEPGVNDSPFDQNLVYTNALVAARNSIGEKWVGFMKNISNNYYAKTTVPAGTQASQANFERAVRTGGEKAINDFNAVLCQHVAKTERGTYICYLASRVPMEQIKLQVAKELELLKIKYDQEILFKTVEGELKKGVVEDKKEGTKKSEKGKLMVPLE
jgi:hypothetical protein